MKKITVRSYIITLLSLAVFVFTSHKADNKLKKQVTPAIFDTESTERNRVVVIHDLHIEPDLDYTEINENQKTLATFLTNIKTSTNVKELVIVGNMLDECFLPPHEDLYNAFIALDIAQSNKGVIEALDGIIQEQKISVTYVHGKHKQALSERIIARRLPGIIQVRNNDFETSGYPPYECQEIAIGKRYSYHYFCASDPLLVKIASTP
jgi:hypothetical protein